MVVPWRPWPYPRQRRRWGTLVRLVSELPTGPEVRRGLRVDVSNHQGDIDWRAVARDDIRFAYLKATEGGDFIDKRFEKNWTGAGSADIDRGAYHFFTLCRPGVDQARNFLRAAAVKTLSYHQRSTSNSEATAVRVRQRNKSTPRSTRSSTSSRLKQVATWCYTCSGTGRSCIRCQMTRPVGRAGLGGSSCVRPASGTSGNSPERQRSPESAVASTST